MFGPKPALSDVTSLLKGSYLSALLFLLFAITATLILEIAQVPFTWALVSDRFWFVFKESVPIGIMATGVGFVIALGQVDISTSGVATLSGLFWSLATYYCTIERGGWDALFLFLLFAVVPLLTGMANAYLVSSRRAPALVVTWAVGTLLFILSALLCSFVAAFLPCESGNGLCATASGIPTSLDYADDFWISAKGAALLAALLLISLFLNRILQFGKQCCAIGANWQSATYNGVRVALVERWAFVLCSMSATIAGVLLAEYSHKAASRELFGQELIAIAVAVLGGTVMSGGYFNIVAIYLSAFSWALLNSSTISYTGPLAETLGARLPVILFALLILIVSFFLGRRLSGHTRAVLVDYHPQ